MPCPSPLLLALKIKFMVLSKTESSNLSRSAESRVPSALPELRGANQRLQ